MRPDEYSAVERAPRWRRSTWSLAAATIGLGALSVALLGALFVRAIPDYLGFPVFVVALVGLVVALIGVGVWLSAGSARKSVRLARLQGRIIWPVRLQTEGHGRAVPATMEISVNGVELTAANQSLAVDWPSVTLLGVSNRGLLRGHRLAFAGDSFGRVEVEILEPNAATKVNEAELREYFATIKMHHLRALGGG